RAGWSVASSYPAAEDCAIRCHLPSGTSSSTYGPGRRRMVYLTGQPSRTLPGNTPAKTGRSPRGEEMNPRMVVVVVCGLAGRRGGVSRSSRRYLLGDMPTLLVKRELKVPTLE